MSAPTELDRLLAEVAAATSPEGAPLALPPRAYTDELLFALERERVIGPGWWCVGRASSWAAPGDYRALEIAGDPVVVTRDRDGSLHALANVCSHRLFPVVEDEAGSAPWLTCRYHLWKYGLDGHLAGAPHMQDVPGFDPGACGLAEYAVEEWLGFVFVSLAVEPVPLAPRLAGLTEHYERYDLPRAVTVARYRKEWIGNWKLGVENGSESYHHTGIHPATVEPYLPSRGTYLEDSTDDWALHRTPLLPEVANDYGFNLDRPSALDADDRAAMKIATVYPGFLVLAIGDFVQWVSWIPISVDRTLVTSEAMFPQEVIDAEPDEAGLRAMTEAGIHQVNSEDEAATVLLQKAAASSRAPRGPLSTKEPVLPLFHRYLTRCLGSGVAAG